MCSKVGLAEPWLILVDICCTSIIKAKETAKLPQRFCFSFICLWTFINRREAVEKQAGRGSAGSGDRFVD